MAQTTIVSAFTDFLNAIVAVFFSLLNSVLAFFQAIAVLGKDIIASGVNLAQSVIGLALGLVQGVYANLLAVVIIGGGGYYFYQRNTNKAGKRKA
ncbi:hypothetical protein DFH08DRAFT_1076168 [Mycena albidolilacea]|uniref:DUF2523 domain-containing protein n=1 Tax=Mycena albidolilacea TaxID=1033008 RepID=A0AAD7AGQ9_9AGAR|nr:hypothetical protein DFH08DRAFT_1076168 [Mycena albidolilacea]